MTPGHLRCAAAGDEQVKAAGGFAAVRPHHLSVGAAATSSVVDALVELVGRLRLFHRIPVLVYFEQGAGAAPGLVE